MPYVVPKSSGCNVRNYARIICRGGDHSKQSILFDPPVRWGLLDFMSACPPAPSSFLLPPPWSPHLAGPKDFPKISQIECQKECHKIWHISGCWILLMSLGNCISTQRYLIWIQQDAASMRHPSARFEHQSIQCACSADFAQRHLSHKRLCLRQRCESCNGTCSWGLLH